MNGVAVLEEPETAAERQDASQSPISAELAAQLADLDEAEQELIAWVVRRAKRNADGDRMPITDITLVHQFLKIDPEVDDPNVFQNIAAFTAPPVIKEYPDCERIELPTDLLPIEFPLGEVIAKRASRRDFSKGPISLRELSSILTYSYGVRGRALAYNVKGFPSRFLPTTGGLQPMEIYFAANAVTGLEQGLYHYNPNHGCIEVLERGNFRRKIVQSTLYQDWVDAASVVFFLVCDMNKLYWKYGRRGYRFVHADLGILGQTMHLVTTALRLRSCLVAGYMDDAIDDMLNIDGRTEFIGLLFAVGRKSWEPLPPEPAAAEPPPEPAAEPTPKASDGSSD